MRGFGTRARLIFVSAVLQYMAAAAVLTLAAAVIASKTGLLHPNLTFLPQLAAYGALGAAMFIALTLQALGLCASFPLVAGAMRPGIRDRCARDFGVLAQIVACTELLRGARRLRRHRARTGRTACVIGPYVPEVRP